MFCVFSFPSTILENLVASFQLQLIQLSSKQKNHISTLLLIALKKTAYSFHHV